MDIFGQTLFKREFWWTWIAIATSMCKRNKSGCCFLIFLQPWFSLKLLCFSPSLSKESSLISIYMYLLLNNPFQIDNYDDDLTRGMDGFPYKLRDIICSVHPELFCHPIYLQRTCAFWTSYALLMLSSHHISTKVVAGGGGGGGVMVLGGGGQQANTHVQQHYFIF